jgi:hypothetical protein
MIVLKLTIFKNYLIVSIKIWKRKKATSLLAANVLLALH